jgi:hypothetical protein
VVWGLYVGWPMFVHELEGELAVGFLNARMVGRNFHVRHVRHCSLLHGLLIFFHGLGH